jgi:hypothetical protein
MPIPPCSDVPSWPDASNFTTLKEDASVPNIDEVKIESYIVYRQSLDKQQNKDVSAFNNGKRLLEHCIEALSLYEDATNQRTFFTGLVHAEYKSRVSYAVKFLLRSSGEIAFSSCECAAGQGPNATCKHIVALCLVVAEFNRTGTLHTLKACTEELQSFHRPKKFFKGNPIPSYKMGKGLGKYDEDPRDVRDKNNPSSVTTNIYNATVAYVQSSGKDVVNRYAFGRANIQQAAKDHDYLREPFINK